MEKDKNDTAIVYESKLRPSEIKISGYKHSATVIIAAALIKSGIVVELLNVPNIDDIKYLVEIIRDLGGSACYSGDKLVINVEGLFNYKIPEKYSQHIHGAMYLLPVLLARFKRVELGNCGGCQIGDSTIIGKRPIDHMLSVVEKFGATFWKKDGKVIGSIDDFTACTINIMDYSEETDVVTGPLISGATKTAILAAAAVKFGKTKIINPYLKPDVTELLKFMEQLGYTVIFESNFIEISSEPIDKAIEKTHLKYDLMSDVSQIMTYISLSVYCNTPLFLTNVTVDKVKKGLKAELDYLDKMGVEVSFTKNLLVVNRNTKILPININVTSFDIYSDSHPFFTLMLLCANGQSLIKEYVWKSRFSYAKQLLKLGFLLKLEGNTLKITPSEPSKGNQILHAHDLRAAAVLLIAPLKVPNKTTIKGIRHLTRGYDGFIEDLITMGARINIEQPYSPSKLS
jgi:UDP-N-acetylglucosamine 1-carboxyvinyltransferase